MTETMNSTRLAPAAVVTIIVACCFGLYLITL